MKKLAALTLCASLAFSSASALIQPKAEASSSPEAVWATVPEGLEVVVDKGAWLLDVYNIDGNNYFKLRDIAMAFTYENTLHPFEVTWDSSNNAINIISDAKYTPIGGECGSYDLALGDFPEPDFEAIMSGVKVTKPAKQAIPSSAVVYINGVKADIKAYNIDGYNYFKLRDLAKALDFEVVWDPVYNMIYTSTYGSYNPQ